MKRFIAVLMILGMVLFAANAMAMHAWWNKPPVQEPDPVVYDRSNEAVIMMHGLFGKPRVFNTLKSMLEDEGFDPSLLFAPNVEDNFKMCSWAHIEQIEGIIAGLPQDVGAIHLVGYSRGGTAIVSFMYFSEMQGSIDTVTAAAGANNYNCNDVYGPRPDGPPLGDALFTSIYGIPTDGTVPAALARLDWALNIEYENMNHFTFMSQEKVLNDIVDAILAGE